MMSVCVKHCYPLLVLLMLSFRWLLLHHVMKPSVSHYTYYLSEQTRMENKSWLVSRGIQLWGESKSNIKVFFYRLLEDIRKASWRVVGVWGTEAGRPNTCRDKSSFNGAWNVAQSWTWRSLLCRLWASREPLAAASHSLYERRRLDRTGLWFPHYVCYPQQRYSNAANSNKQLTRRRPLPVAPWQNKSTSRQKVQSHVIVKKCDLCH